MMTAYRITRSDRKRVRIVRGRSDTDAIQRAIGPQLVWSRLDKETISGNGISTQRSHTAIIRYNDEYVPVTVVVTNA